MEEVVIRKEGTKWRAVADEASHTDCSPLAALLGLLLSEVKEVAIPHPMTSAAACRQAAEMLDSGSTNDEMIALARLALRWAAAELSDRNQECHPPM